MTSASTESQDSPDVGVGCDAQVVIAGFSHFELRNRNKAQNFIIGEIVAGGELSFIVENLPKDGRGCRGKWMFDVMMRHFGSTVTMIQGNWTYGDNLAIVNQLTLTGIGLEEAAKQTFTGKRAVHWGFTRVTVVSIVGSAGAFSAIHVLFEN